MKPLLAIVGPTATGKTGLALKLAREFDGEIVNADSRQVYRHMDIGTAKPTPAEQAKASHHLFDVVDPDEDFSLALYQELVYVAINDIHDRGKLPMLVGGSGLYIWAVLEGWSIPKVPPHPQFRRELEARAISEGTDALHLELQSIDPEAATQIDSRNLRRVIRALEICQATGKRFSDLKKKNPPDFDTHIFGLTAEREELYRRIDLRVDRMVQEGFIEEVQGLIARGYSLELPAMSSLGYREIGRFLSGDLDLSEGCQQIKYATHRFARHQYAWFRLKDERISWFDSVDEENEIAAQIEANLRR
ncbi:MAG: tRNA (adenosine(37)-N6)-dimethylallyltransferase MiaA [Chloroflexota bacterium]|nr:tRNA (adenosine(37)-N6)-dimethylallyltransferase MiaA [Chloroflexota bacterium]